MTITASAVPTVGELLTGWRLVTSILGILVLAFVASRLLGTRRSLGAIVVSGAVGWFAGAALAVVLARHDRGRSGFLPNLWLFSAFFTMAATVVMEMLARPGVLARAQHRLSSTPRPMRALRRKGQRISRYAQIMRIAARQGLGPTLGIDGDRGARDERDGRGEPGERGAPMAGPTPLEVRVRRALEDAGGMFVKLGQVLSTRADLLPPELVGELSRLQDDVSPAPRPAVERSLAAELGRPIDEVFVEFDWTPLAAASIGQAYRARLRSGELVVVKVQRPGIAAAVERDLDVLTELVGMALERAPWAAEQRIDELAGEFAGRLRDELDFRIEARNAAEIGRRLREIPRIRVPRVHEHLTTARVLVMERFDGTSARHRDEIAALGFDGAELAQTLLRASLHQMLVDGHFHSDPHPGNVLVLPDGSVGLIDFGATGRLDPIQQAAVRQMMLAISRRDPSLLRQAITDVATVGPDFDDDAFERGLARFMTRHLGLEAAPSAEMFNDLLQLLFGFGVVLPAEFSTFFRALITLEGTLTALSPGFQVIGAAQQVAMEWVEERLVPATVTELAKDEMLRLLPQLRRLPRHVDRIATIVERGDLHARVSLLSEEGDRRFVSTLVNRALLALIGGVVGIVSVILLGVHGGPAFTGSTSLYEFFGYFGLFCSAVLIMRVLVAIFRDGLN